MSDQARWIERGLLAISSEPQKSAYLITVFGEMDGSNARDLEDELIRLGNDGRSEIVLDLSQLEFIDSTGLAVILRAHHRMRNNGHSLSVVRPLQAQVGHAFVLSGLDTALLFAQ